jgi:hypothetical protein
LTWASWLFFLAVHKTGVGKFRPVLLTNFNYPEGKNCISRLSE